MTKTIQLIETYQFETKHFGIVRINLTTGNGLYNITIISNLIMCEKTWHKIFAGFISRCIIKLECDLNETWTYISLWQGINRDISWTNHWLKIQKSMFLNPIWDFNTIKFKVSFITNWVTSCRFYWLDLIGNQDVWK
jgi:hypothetical protein